MSVNHETDLQTYTHTIGTTNNYILEIGMRPLSVQNEQKTQIKNDKLKRLGV